MKHICHPQSSSEGGGISGKEGAPVAVGSWKPPTNVELEA